MARKKSNARTLTKKKTGTSGSKKSAGKRKSAARPAGKKKSSPPKRSGKVAASKKRPAKKKSKKKTAAASPPAPAMPAHGGWAWHELMTSDLAGAKRFYGELFGWSFGDMPMGGFNYTLIKQSGSDQGGMMPMSGPEWQGVPSHWMIYIMVDDVDATASKCAEMGGRICVPPTDIPVGRFAVLTDPAGATFSIYKSKSM